MSNPLLLETRGLSMTFPVKKGIFQRTVGHIHAVQDVDLTLGRGQTLGIVGESGSGKSTLARTIIRLLTPTGGQILLDGRDIGALPGRRIDLGIRSRMQMVFQDPYSSLNPRQRVFQILEEPLEVHHPGMAPSERRRIVTGLMETVGLEPDHGRRFAHQFSGGQRQRIAIARALTLKPDILIADEPVSALDVSIQAQILGLFEKLQAERGLSYLFISHDLSVVRHISTQVLVMYLGRVMENAPRDTLFSAYRHPYTQALMSAVPRVPKDGVEAPTCILLKDELPDPANPPEGCVFHTRCNYTQELCRHTRPPIREIGLNHKVACHFPL